MRHRSSISRVVTCAVFVVAAAVPMGFGALPSASAAKTYLGPDVASYQHPHATSAHPHGQPINWAKVAKSGKAFAIVKATEGTSYTNPYFAGPYYDDYADAAAAGLVKGSYHFARPALPIVSTAIAQAKFYAKTIGPVDTVATLPPALDLEVTGGLDPAQLVTWAQTFLLEMRKITGRTPMLYTYPNFWEDDLADPGALARYPLWMAEYGVARAPVSDLWQYTDHAHINGIVGGVDVSRFVGSSGFPWKVLSDGTQVTPWVVSAPGAPSSPVATVDGTDVTVSWLPGDTGTSRVTRYRVTASPGGAVQTVNGKTFSTTFDNLSTKSSYTFTVTASNQVGTGTPSTPTAPVTPTIPTLLATHISPSLTYGGTLPLLAKLTRSDTKAALAGRRVLIFRRTSLTSAWVQIRKLRTDARGLVSSVLRPKRSAELETVFPGAKGVARSSTFESYVVRPTVTAALSSDTVRHGGHVTLSGTAVPFFDGQQVMREGLLDGQWQVWATTSIGPRGRFIFRIHPKTKATEIYRVVVAASSSHGSGHSPRLTLTVT
jgi:GH25 family lysozyme M1 (1,4-beta-N-acetylmuramidase)